MSKFIKTSTSVNNLRCKQAWQCLTVKEKNYAYYLSKSSWAGAKMVLHQIAYEGPLIFCLLQHYFKGNDFQSLKSAALQQQVSEEEYQQFVAYSAGFYGNMGNYQSFGHNKFIPELSEQTFHNILLSNPRSESDPLYKQYIDKLYTPIQKELFCIDHPYDQLNFPEKGGVTAYFSRNMKESDLALVKQFMKTKDIDPLNTRTFKTDNNCYTISVGSVDKSSQIHDYEGNTFKVERGEFSSYLSEAIQWLTKCLPHCANTNQTEMIQKYISHYQSGIIGIHKESQVAWVNDKQPVVESNQGWIEVYIDPENTRGYFEGWVAIVDKPKSEKFQALVKMSEQVIPKLPWPKVMEKENFLAPDFTTLEVISFATNGCPLGINIPNYDDIRESIGFKNVYLNNAMPTISKQSVQFATDEQAELLSSLGSRSYVVHVACHELLGHGTGRNIFRNKETGEDMTFIDPVDDSSFRSCYEINETYNEKFGSISTSYEECRADTCGFYLAALPEIYSLFGIKDTEKDDMLWCSVMSQLRKAILGLSLYNTKTNKWGQAHTQGAFVFTQFLLQNQTTDIVRLELTEDAFVIHLNKENLLKEGQELIKKLLVILQTYKSSGAVKKAQDFYGKYSAVDDLCLQIREIVQAQKKPRRLVLNNNLTYYSEEVIEVSEYPECHEGVIASFLDRYGAEYKMIDQIYEEWQIYQSYLRVEQQ